MADKKLTKRQIQASSTQEKLYKIALEMIERKGFQHITVEEICKEAGVSVGSFYNYFKSKNEILDRVFQVADEYFETVVAEKIKIGTAQERIIAFFDSYADYNVERGLDHATQLFTTKNNLFAIKGRPMQVVLQKVIEEGQTKGELTTEVTPEEEVRFLFIGVRGVVYDWCLHKGEYDLNEAIRWYVSRVVKALS